MRFLDLNAAILAVGIPIDGVSGNPTDRTTWQVRFRDGVTDAQRAQAQAIMDACPEDAPAPEVVPDISDRQFACGLWGDGIITYDEFRGFIGPGTIPASIQAIVEQLPDDDTGKPTPRKMAIGFLTGSKLYSFSHPLVEFFRQSLVANDPKWTPDYLRQQWLLWSSL